MHCTNIQITWQASPTWKLQNPTKSKALTCLSNHDEMTKLRSSPKPIMGVSISNTFCMPIQVFFLLTNMGVLSLLICYIIASHLILFICLCLISPLWSNLHQGRAGQFTMTMKILLVCMMYDYYDFFYLFLFLDKIIHLRMINDFFPDKNMCLWERRWIQQMRPTTCGKSQVWA